MLFFTALLKSSNPIPSDSGINPPSREYTFFSENKNIGVKTTPNAVNKIPHSNENTLKLKTCRLESFAFILHIISRCRQSKKKKSRTLTETTATMGKIAINTCAGGYIRSIKVSSLFQDNKFLKIQFFNFFKH